MRSRIKDKRRTLLVEILDQRPSVQTETAEPQGLKFKRPIVKPPKVGNRNASAAMGFRFRIVAKR